MLFCRHAEIPFLNRTPAIARFAPSYNDDLSSRSLDRLPSAISNLQLSSFNLFLLSGALPDRCIRMT